MKKIKQFLFKHAGSIAAFAMVLGIYSMDSACFIMYHQPKIPDAMNIYRS